MSVLRLVDFKADCGSWDPKMLLEEFKEAFEKGELECNGLILIMVQRTSQNFNCDWWKAQVLNSEAVVALELVRDDLIQILKGEA